MRLQLRRRWSDGTSHVLFDPVELLERLTAITPRPRVNLIPYIRGTRCTSSVANASRAARHARHRTRRGQGASIERPRNSSNVSCRNQPAWHDSVLSAGHRSFTMLSSARCGRQKRERT